MILSPAQCRAARKALGWTPEDLAHAAGVSIFTVRHFEEGRPAERATVLLLRRAFEGAGIEFDTPEREGVGIATGHR